MIRRQTEKAIAVPAIACPVCNTAMVPTDPLNAGQRVLCPFCGNKFLYGSLIEKVVRFRLRCPYCNNIVETEKELCPGQKLYCDSCGNKFWYLDDPTSEKHISVKCEHCGKEVEVSGEVQKGQHILCPHCNSKFSYQMPENWRVDVMVVKSSENASMRPKITESGASKSKVKFIAKLMDENNRHREWKRMLTTRAVFWALTFFLLLAASLAYSIYKSAIDSRLEMRNAIVRYINDNRPLLHDFEDKYSERKTKASNEMWRWRGDPEKKSHYYARVLRYRDIQNEVYNVLQSFNDVASKIDYMNLSELRASQSEMSALMKDLLARVESDEVVVEDDFAKTKASTSPGTGAVTLRDSNLGLKRQIASLKKELKKMKYPFDDEDLKKMTPQDQLDELVEMFHDAEMREKKFRKE